MKPTNLDIQDVACLHAVQILQHPTSRPTTMPTHYSMVNTPKKNLSPFAAGKYSKSMKTPTRPHHQAKEGKSGLEAERVRALEALSSSRSKKKLSAKKGQQTHLLGKEDKEKWIKNYMDRETAVARNQVHDPQTASMQEQDHMRNVEKAQSTTTKPETTFQVMLNVIGDSLSDLASSEDDEDGEDEDHDEEDTEVAS